MDAQTKFETEECASSMGQKSTDAAAKDAQNMSSMEVCAKDTGQLSMSNDAAAKDAQIKFEKKECALDTGKAQKEKKMLYCWMQQPIIARRSVF